MELKVESPQDCIGQHASPLVGRVCLFLIRDKAFPYLCGDDFPENCPLPIVIEKAHD
jgi:hypothetical protein